MNGSDCSAGIYCCSFRKWRMTIISFSSIFHIDHSLKSHQYANHLGCWPAEGYSHWPNKWISVDDSDAQMFTFLLYIFVVSCFILDWFHSGLLAVSGQRLTHEPFHWAFCDGSWIIHLNMIDRRIELRDWLISGLVKRSPNDHWNLSVS